MEHSIPSELLAEGYKLVVNGTGRFADPGGPYADAGLTGRKIIVDTYGGMGRHGGGAFSEKIHLKWTVLPPMLRDGQPSM